MSVTLSDKDYKRLLLASEGDDMIIRCDHCGAWSDRDDPKSATSDDVSGCWYYTTADQKYASECFRHNRPSASDVDMNSTEPKT